MERGREGGRGEWRERGREWEGCISAFNPYLHHIFCTQSVPRLVSMFRSHIAGGQAELRDNNDLQR